MKFEDLIKDEDNRYLINKIDWLEHSNLSDKTKITYYRLFQANVLPVEEAYKKDVSKFSTYEIENLIRGILTNVEQTKRSTFSAISSYLGWCVENDIISYNPCDNIADARDLYRVNTNVVKEKYNTLNEFYNWLDSLSIDDNMKLVLVMCRYGVPIKEISSVRWDDLDKENKELYVTIKDKLLQLPVDSEFVNRVDKALRCDETFLGKEYKDIGYMIKSLKPNKLSTSGVYSLVLKASEESNIDRIDVGYLYKNRKIDLIMELLRSKSELFTEDLEWVLGVLGLSNSPTQCTILSRELSEVFGIEVKTHRTGKEIVVIYVDTGEVFGEYESVSACAKDLSERVGNISRSTILRHIRMDTDFYGLKFIKEE